MLTLHNIFSPISSGLDSWRVNLKRLATAKAVGGAMHRYGALAADLGWVALAPLIALLIRDNFVFYPPDWEAITPYAAISAATFTVVFMITGPHKTLWKYTSLPDVLRVITAVTIALLLALFIRFLHNRLEGVMRAVPIIQWFVVVGGMVGMRVAVRIWHERARRKSFIREETSVQRVLIVGTSELTELYLRSVAKYSPTTIEIVGILSSERELRGRRLRQYEILGTPEELPQILARLEVHGVIIERIVVMQPLRELSGPAAQAVLAVERGSGVQVDWMLERLGLDPAQTHEDEPELDPSLQDPGSSPALLMACEIENVSFGTYGYVKRGLDVLATLFLGVVLAPLILAISLLVALDIGLPLVFWQQRPGRFGRPFKLFKFRTMRSAHDTEGKRVPDEQRSSYVGNLLRRTRLDELPQLYNILIGEMSLVGPRPLLHVDQPEEMKQRLLVRPGLTGFAQVHGGRNISAEDKNTLDVWYVRNASLWLDVKILLRTSMVLIKGERVDQHIISAAREECPKRPNSANLGSHSLTSKSFLGDGQINTVPS